MSPRMPTMFPKLLALVIGLAVIAAALLAVRHQELRTANEMSQVHARIAERQRALWSLRCEAASRCRPEDVRLLAQELPFEWMAVTAPEAAGQAPGPVRLAPPPFRKRGPATALVPDEEPFGG